MLLQAVEERFLRPAQAQAILHLHVAGMALGSIGIPDEVVDGFGFGGQDIDVMTLRTITQVDPLVSHS